MRMLVCGGHTDGLNTQNGWYRGIAGRDEDIVVITNDKRQLIHVVERIAREVYLATLTVTQHHPVVAHPRMLGSKPSYRDCLQTSCTTIVTEGNARNTMQGIGHIGHTKTQHLLTIDNM